MPANEIYPNQTDENLNKIIDNQIDELKNNISEEKFVVYPDTGIPVDELVSVISENNENSEETTKVIPDNKELTEEEKHELFIKKLKESKIKFHSIKHPVKKGLVTVSGKLSDDVKKGTLGSVLRQAGLK